MNRTGNNREKLNIESKRFVNTGTLTAWLDCGRSTAVKIGTVAGARFQMGRRVLWDTKKSRGT